MDNQYAGKVAVVTGGGSGIGAATVLELLRRGASVVAVDRDANGLAEIERLGAAIAPRIGTLAGDIALEATSENMVALAVQRFGGLNFAVNNAGIGIARQPLDEATDDRWRKVMDVNFGGIVYGMRHEARAMLAGGGGAIVNVGSVYSQLGMAMMNAYPASKHAVLGYTRSAALDLAPRGIRVNQVSPGVIATGLTAAANREAIERQAAKSPLKRLGEPEELARAICFLLSDDASFIIGANLVVDGGYTLT